MRRMLYVYTGVGADEKSCEQLFASLKKIALPTKHEVEYITPEHIVKGEWVKNAALLAIGGGYDLGLIKSLGNSGISTIRKFVEDGGSYLGLCSGGYFGCDFIEFDKSGPLEVCGERHLKFFPGLCIGPVFPGFKYKSFSGAVAAPTEFWDADEKTIETFHSYFNGGGYFKLYDKAKDILTNHIQDTDQTPSHKQVGRKKRRKLDTGPVKSVEVLSTYSSLEGSPISTVKTKFGKGVVVLSGVHLEYSANALPLDDLFVEKMIDKLKSSEDTRFRCFVSLLKHLSISCQEF